MRGACHLGSLAATVLVCGAVAGCGSGSAATTSTAQLAPQQYETGKRIEAYIPAMNAVMASTRRPPTDPRDLARATRILDVQVSQLEQLNPPPAFAEAQRNLVTAVKAELAEIPQLAAALRANNPILKSNAQARVDETGGRTRAALAAIGAVLERCRTDSFSC